MTARIYFHPNLSAVHAARLAFILGWQIRTNARGRLFLLPPTAEPARCGNCIHTSAPPDALGVMALCTLDGLPRITSIERECGEFEGRTAGQ